MQMKIFISDPFQKKFSVLGQTFVWTIQYKKIVLTMVSSQSRSSETVTLQLASFREVISGSRQLCVP